MSNLLIQRQLNPVGEMSMHGTRALLPPDKPVGVEMAFAFPSWMDARYRGQL